MADDDLSPIAEQLDALAEQLAELALDRLRTATDPDDPRREGAAAEERRITRARRSLEKATAALRAGSREPELP